MTGHPNLKIIADDLGLHKSVNDGIIFLLREGKIDGASLMANGEAFDDAAKQILDVGLKSIGVHLNLVEQRSVVSGGLMHKNHRLFFLKYILRLVNKDYIWRELEAQVRKIIQAGIKPSFINGNQHLHLLPGIMDMCIKLATKYDIPYIRIVSEPVNLSGGKFFRKLQLLFLNFLSAAAKKKIRRAGLQCNDFFVGFINAGNMRDSGIKYAENLAQKYPDKIVELGCHPGYESEDLKIKFKHWGDYNWQSELVILSKFKVEN